jgi:transposase
MYSNVRQWKRIRNRVLLAGESRRAVAASENISRNTLRKMLLHDVPPCVGSLAAKQSKPGLTRKRSEAHRSSLESVNQRWAEWLCSVERGSPQTARAGSRADVLRQLLTKPPNDPRKRLLSIMALDTGFSIRATAEHLGLTRNTVRNYRAAFTTGGLEKLLSRKSRPRKVDDEAFSAALFALLHEPPSLSGYNRTTWRLQDLKAALTAGGHRVSRDVISQAIKKAGFRWRSAKVVLTSNDPDYRQKLERVQSCGGRPNIDHGFRGSNDQGRKAALGAAVCG